MKHPIFKNSVGASKKISHFNITKIKWLMFYKEVIEVYSEKHKKLINTICRVPDYESKFAIFYHYALKG
jgi:hypothetical protein